MCADVDGGRAGRCERDGGGVDSGEQYSGSGGAGDDRFAADFPAGGTISHELGHRLSLLDHPSGAQANPGASAYSIMGTGASPTNMPNDQRILDRAFSYAEFDQLITAVGTQETSVPEPRVFWMSGVGLLVLVGMRLRG